jgi:hypothetical protein
MQRPLAPRSVARELLSGVSDLTMRELCVRALRQACANRSDDQIGLNGDLCGTLTGLLAKHKGWTLYGNPSGTAPEVVSRDPAGVREALFGALGEQDGAPVFEFVNWFVRAGLGWPICDSKGLPHTLRLTRAGRRFLQSSEDHPLLPGFLERTADRCPGLPSDVLSLMADARECLDHGLMRPAVVLLGVAYEVAVEHVAQSLVGRGVLDASILEKSASKRIEAIRSQIETLLPGNRGPEKDDRREVEDAYVFADQLRRRRNDASHTTPTYGFEDRAEVEELIVSAGRQLPNLWRIR